MTEKLSSIEFFLMLAIIIVAAKGAGWLSSRAGQPAVFGELVAGLLALGAVFFAAVAPRRATVPA